MSTVTISPAVTTLAAADVADVWVSGVRKSITADNTDKALAALHSIYLVKGLSASNGTNNSALIQAAIDAAYTAGGGAVLVKLPGSTLTLGASGSGSNNRYSLMLKTGVDLFVDDNTTIMQGASQNAHMVVNSAYITNDTSVRDSNISIIGGKWDANRDQQQQGGTNQVYESAIVIARCDGFKSTFDQITNAYLDFLVMFDLTRFDVGPIGKATNMRAAVQIFAPQKVGRVHDGYFLGLTDAAVGPGIGGPGLGNEYPENQFLGIGGGDFDDVTIENNIAENCRVCVGPFHLGYSTNKFHNLSLFNNTMVGNNTNFADSYALSFVTDTVSAATVIHAINTQIDNIKASDCTGALYFGNGNWGQVQVGKITGKDLSISPVMVDNNSINCAIVNLQIGQLALSGAHPTSGAFAIKGTANVQLGQFVASTTDIGFSLVNIFGAGTLTNFNCDDTIFSGANFNFIRKFAGGVLGTIRFGRADITGDSNSYVLYATGGTQNICIGEDVKLHSMAGLVIQDGTAPTTYIYGGGFYTTDGTRTLYVAAGTVRVNGPNIALRAVAVDGDSTHQVTSTLGDVMISTGTATLVGRIVCDSGTANHYKQWGY